MENNYSEFENGLGKGNIFDINFSQVEALKIMLLREFPDAELRMFIELDIEEDEGIRTSIFNYKGRDVAIVTMIPMVEDNKYGIILKVIEKISN